MRTLAGGVLDRRRVGAGAEARRIGSARPTSCAAASRCWRAAFVWIALRVERRHPVPRDRRADDPARRRARSDDGARDRVDHGLAVSPTRRASAPPSTTRPASSAARSASRSSAACSAPSTSPPSTTASGVFAQLPPDAQHATPGLGRRRAGRRRPARTERPPFLAQVADAFLSAASASAASSPPASRRRRRLRQPVPARRRTDRPGRPTAPPASRQLGDARLPPVHDRNELVGPGVGHLDRPGGESPPSEVEAGAEGGRAAPSTSRRPHQDRRLTCQWGAVSIGRRVVVRCGRYARRHQHVHLYKHVDSRRYLNLDHAGFAYRYHARDRGLYAVRFALAALDDVIGSRERDAAALHRAPVGDAAASVAGTIAHPVNSTRTMEVRARDGPLEVRST